MSQACACSGVAVSTHSGLKQAGCDPAAAHHVQADTGSGAPLSQCMPCQALGRDTCTSLLASGGIASWGGLLMALLFACAAALAHVVATRILTQKQVRSRSGLLLHLNR